MLNFLWFPYPHFCRKVLPSLITDSLFLQTMRVCCT